ncbi:hypothetical protein AB0N17_43920 [Streptomyces sp. NPDC051133]|uniref:hypothetical protein n=1 Tax=Streptomyces sp. NPDC051133 TaxID=3155521 RepID=UPI003435A5E0
MLALMAALQESVSKKKASRGEAVGSAEVQNCRSVTRQQPFIGPSCHLINQRLNEQPLRLAHAHEAAGWRCDPDAHDCPQAPSSLRIQT